MDGSRERCFTRCPWCRCRSGRPGDGGGRKRGSSMDQVGTFRRIADVLRSAQGVAGLLGVPQKALRLASTRIAAERPAAPRARLTFSEVEALRLVFQAA